MHYVSSRGGAPALGFEDVLLAGLARDGGLYLPARYPALDPDRIAAMADRPYAEVAAEVMAPFVGDAFEIAALRRIAAEVYAGFDDPAVAPLRDLGRGHWLMELFHGPTLAFKDFALQFLGRLFAIVLDRRGARATIIGATSGDTGSAAIAGVRGLDAVDIFILYPEGRVSEVQRRQMTTVADRNVHAVAIQGTFDDCQALVKAMFNDLALRDALHLAAVNSINWARVMAQIVYYVTAWTRLGAPAEGVSFSVPTGNFGDVFAGYVAKRMGLPVGRLIVATNRNDILARFLASGEYRKSEVEPTLSPSMDIGVASNFERLLFEIHDRDPDRVSALMAELERDGGFRVADPALARTRADFTAARIDEADCLAAIAKTWRQHHILIDPHTAVALAAARRLRLDHETVVTLGTAHAAKFPDAVARATGVRPDLPPHLADLYERPERMVVLPNDPVRVQEFVRTHARIAAPA